jgi:hypothetical protein
MWREDCVTSVLFVVLIALLVLITIGNIVTVIECPKHGGEVHGSFPAECYGARR